MSTAERTPAIAFRLGSDAEANLARVVSGLTAERGEPVTSTSAMRWALKLAAERFAAAKPARKKSSK